MFAQPTITQRVTRIDRVAQMYLSNSGSDPDAIATDMLADIMHWCAAHSVQFDEMLGRAESHYDFEQEEESAR